MSFFFLSVPFLRPCVTLQCPCLSFLPWFSKSSCLFSLQNGNIYQAPLNGQLGYFGLGYREILHVAPDQATVHHLYPCEDKRKTDLSHVASDGHHSK